MLIECFLCILSWEMQCNLSFLLRKMWHVSYLSHWLFETSFKVIHTFLHSYIKIYYLYLEVILFNWVYNLPFVWIKLWGYFAIIKVINLINSLLLSFVFTLVFVLELHINIFGHAVGNVAWFTFWMLDGISMNHAIH